MNNSRNAHPPRMISKNSSIRPDQEDWVMSQAAQEKITYSEAMRAVIDLAWEIVMKTQIRLFGQSIPIEIEEEKIPGLIEKFFPAISKTMESAKSLGIDLAPAVQKFIGTSQPASQSLLPPEGSVIDHTGAVVKFSSIMDLVKLELSKTAPQPVSRDCGGCSNRHPTYFGPNAISPTCKECLLTPGKPRFAPLPGTPG